MLVTLRKMKIMLWSQFLRAAPTSGPCQLLCSEHENTIPELKTLEYNSYIENTRIQYLHPKHKNTIPPLRMCQNTQHTTESNTRTAAGGEHICIQVTGRVKMHPARTHVSSLFPSNEKIIQNLHTFHAKKLLTPKHNHPCIIPSASPQNRFSQ